MEKDSEEDEQDIGLLRILFLESFGSLKTAVADLEQLSSRHQRGCLRLASFSRGILVHACAPHTYACARAQSIRPDLLGNETSSGSQ